MENDAPLDLTRFRALSFDCYGTLIDWETGILAVLQPWADEHGLETSGDELLLAYGTGEATVEREAPTTRYPDVVAEAFRLAGRSLGVAVSEAWADRIAGSIGDWPAFPDSAEALAELAERYDLFVVSNVDRASFGASNARLRGRFADVITAEDVGAYKPADPHFEALDRSLAARGIGTDQLLHVAQSLSHDHVPAHRRGLRSVWINRRHDRPGWGATLEPEEPFSYDREYASMREFAAAVTMASGSDPEQSDR